MLATAATRHYSENTTIAPERQPFCRKTSTACEGIAIDNHHVTKAEAAATKMEILERVEKVEANLLKEFRKWARSFESRVRVNELTVAGHHERMGLIEERVSELENPS